MAFLEPVFDFFGFGGQDNPPIYTTLPKTVKAFENKYTDPEFSSYFGALPSNIQRPLLEMDRERVLRGQQPYSKKQFVRAGQTAVNNEAFTPPPDRKATNVLSNFFSDVRQLTTSIPRIPMALVDEVQQLPEIGEHIAAADSPADILQAPGIRMLPFTYTAANLLNGKAGIQEALTHPLFTTLDVLPAAKPGVKALGKTAVGEAAIEAGTKASQAFQRTRPGQTIKQAFGKEARDATRLAENQNSYIREVLNPDSKIVTDAQIAGDPVAVAARSSVKLKDEFPTISQERLDEITRQARLDRNQLNLSDVERGLLERYDEIQDVYRQEGLRRGWFAEFDGEIYSKKDAKALLKGKKTVEDVVPARFRPELRRRLEEQIKLTYATPANIDKVTQALTEGNYRGIPGFDEAEVAAWADDLNQNWMALRDQGVDPVFVHQIPPGAEAATKYPRVLEKLLKPSQVRQQINDVTPYANDLTVGLTHQGLELLSRQGSELFAEAITNQFSKPWAVVQDELMPLARKRAARSGRDLQTELQALVYKQYADYNPNELFPFKKVKITPEMKAERRLIPRSVAKNVERMREPAENGVTAALDPVMGVFRTAVLPLSPRWHLNNLVGGSMALLLEDPAAFRFGKNAAELLRKGETTIDGRVLTLADMPDDFKFALGASSRVQQEFAFRAGGTMRRLLGEVNAQRLAGNWESIRKAGGKITGKSFEWNAHIDDWYRAVAYLKGADDVLKKGKSLTESEVAGIALTRKVMQTWNDITPIERSVLRYIFPFYNFSRFITKYALRYPIDHPFRAAVMGSIARKEVEDMGTSLPEKFLNNFFLGEPDKNGNVKSIQFGGMNPFRDVANYFTLSGALSQSNPLFQTIAEQFGIDTMTGGPELYPSMSFDAETGRLGVRTGNPLMGLLQNTIPQSQVLLGLSQSSSEFKDVMQRNPEAAAAMMRSNLGLPVIFRTINVPEEQTRAEIARYESQQDAYRQALRTGSDEEATRYENLRPLLSQIRQLQDNGQLEEFAPSGQQVDPLEVAQQAIIRANAP